MKYLLVLLFTLVSCNSAFLEKENSVSEKKASNKDILNWFQKKPIQDSISGINSDLAYQLVKSKKTNTIIIAILDCSIDNGHETLINKIWVNKDEISNNNVDDDNNGYIDDVHGWNFLGTQDSTSMVLHSSTDAIRIIREFEDNDNPPIISKADNHDKYHKALKHTKDDIKKANQNVDDSDYITENYALAQKNVINPYFKDENYTLEQLQAIESKDTLVQDSVDFLSKLIEYGMDKEWMKSFIYDSNSELKKTYNRNYNERDEVNQWSESVENINYGHNNLFCNLDKNSHATRIGAVIAGIGNDKISNGILKKVLLMPISIGPYSGNEHDKDIALGIRYAVDNGAKVINMSFGKPLSYKSEWVFEAIKYAESKNVILVTSAGNNAENGDLEENFRYPNDNDYEKPEVADNFLMVGSTGPKVDSTFVSGFSNYGKKNVDLFAPGSEFITAWPGNKYKKDGGTSISSAVVAAIAGLVFQYYPNLSASQVKHILMDSGTSYDLNVYVGSGEDKKKLSFKELSKSGKVINAYNALLMAEEISKKME